MKEEIERILYDSMDSDDIDGAVYLNSFNNDNASKELQKLFLSKQIKLLSEFWWLESPALDEKIRKLSNELKQLQ